MTTDEINKAKLLNEACDNITSGEWRYCERWAYRKYKGLTDKGWQQALKDSETVISDLEKRLIKLKDIRTRIQSLLNPEKAEKAKEEPK